MNRTNKQLVCPHTMSSNGRNIKSYAMNMCKACCWERGIYKSYATNCEHKTRPHYVKGYCRQCYNTKFEVPKRKKMLKEGIEDNLFCCPHQVSKNGIRLKPYAMNLCKQCCWERGIYKSYATKCQHTDR